MTALYRDRVEAARRLADQFVEESPKHPLVLAIPRGGVVTGFELARRLSAELDIVVPRKLGAPGEPELAIGAVMHDGTIFLNEAVFTYVGASEKYLHEERERQMQEAQRRLKVYRGNRPYPNLQSRTVIVVDDGIATGATMIAAIRWAKSQGAEKVIAAAPVAPPQTFESLRKEADSVVCPELPEPFFAIGQFYDEFPSVEDMEVIELLRRNWQEVQRQSQSAK